MLSQQHKRLPSGAFSRVAVVLETAPSHFSKWLKSLADPWDTAAGPPGLRACTGAQSPLCGRPGNEVLVGEAGKRSPTPLGSVLVKQGSFE